MIECIPFIEDSNEIYFSIYSKHKKISHTHTIHQVFDDVAVEISMAILQFLSEKQPSVPEPLCWRGLKALLRCCQLARGEVPNLIKMVGPNPGELKGTASPRCDEIIDSILGLMK